MNNLKYLEIIKSKLKEIGYSTNLDALAKQVIQVADKKEINAIVYLESHILNKKGELKFNQNLNKQINSFNNGMAFTSQRHSSPQTNRFINRQIFQS